MSGLRVGGRAISIRAKHPENVHIIVELIDRIDAVPERRQMPDGRWHRYRPDAIGKPAWVVRSLGRLFVVMGFDSGLPQAPSEFGSYPPDWLRPLLDSDGADESLTWAGKPQDAEDRAPCELEPVHPAFG